MIITWIFRNIDVNHESDKSSGEHNPNGGVCSKAFHFARAMPHAKVITDIEQAGDICFAEVLWFLEFADATCLEPRIEQWEKLDSFKIIANSDLALFRMPGHFRDRLIDASDLVITTSAYGQQLFEAFTDKAVLLYDPIDIDMFVPLKKEREIYSIGQINLEKNVQMIIDIFSQIPKELELIKTYIGSGALWGQSTDIGLILEGGLHNSCDYLETQLSQTEIPERIGRIWGYAGDTRYDMACFGMMEAMLVGCWLFTGRHLMYDERPGLRFGSVDEAIKQICIQLEQTPPESGIINEEARQFIVDKNGYDSFRRQLKNLIGRYAFGL